MRYDGRMRSRILAFVPLLISFALVLPLVAYAGGIPFFGPIIPEEYSACPAGWGMLITVFNNIISLLITLAAVFVAPLMIAYSGFLFVVNPVNPSGREDAKTILTHTIVGLVIALSGWLIVDAIMAVLYHPNGSIGSTWSQLITGNPNDPCLHQEGTLPGNIPSQSNAVTSGGTGQGLVVAPKSIIAPAPPATFLPGAPTMSQAALQSAARAASRYSSQVCDAAAAQGIPDQCKQLLGILAVESGGNPTITSGKGAIGLMQLIPTTAAASGVSACAGSTNTNPSAACIAALKDPKTNITAGVTEYAKLYKTFNDPTNATAAYNAGSGDSITQAGKKNAFAPSSDCPGLYAWQCPKNPGGFIETQAYVPNVNAVASTLTI